MGEEDEKRQLTLFFKALKSFFTVGKTSIDSFVLQLHYSWTFVILLTCSLLSMGIQFLGDPIDCISKDDIPTKLLETFCWIHSTFSLPSAWNKTVGVEVPYPGVDKFTPGEKRVYHAYYQWVCFVLFLQAVLFYVPRYIWKAVEGKRIHNLTNGLRAPIPKGNRTQQLQVIHEYLKENIGTHFGYFFFYTAVHLLNFINVVGQIFLIDRFLGNEFTTYGVRVAEFTEWEWSVRYDPMVKVFPRLVKCTFYRYGSSGDIQRHDAMCILPLNIINEKIFVAMWFWFVFLAIVTFLDLVYRILCSTVKKIRFYVIKAHSPLAKSSDLQKVVESSPTGDWIMLSLLSKNMDPLHFKDVISMYATTLRETKRTVIPEISHLRKTVKELRLYDNRNGKKVA